MTDFELEIKALKEKVESLEKRNNELETQLNTYLDRKNQAQRKYVQANPELTKERKLAHYYKLKETNPESLKAHRHQAYLNRKARLQAQKEEQTTDSAQ